MECSGERCWYCTKNNTNIEECFTMHHSDCNHSESTLRTPVIKLVDVDLFTPTPDKPGYQTYVGRKNVREVLEELEDSLHEYYLRTHEEYARDTKGMRSGCYPGCSEGFSVFSGFLYDHGGHRSNPAIPEGRTTVYARTGSNEGHYVHVEVQHNATKIPTTIMMGKTFDGFDAAWGFAKMVAFILQV